MSTFPQECDSIPTDNLGSALSLIQANQEDIRTVLQVLVDAVNTDLHDNLHDLAAVEFDLRKYIKNNLRDNKKDSQNVADGLVQQIFGSLADVSVYTNAIEDFCHTRFPCPSPHSVPLEWPTQPFIESPIPGTEYYNPQNPTNLLEGLSGPRGGNYSVPVFGMGQPYDPYANTNPATPEQNGQIPQIQANPGVTIVRIPNAAGTNDIVLHINITVLPAPVRIIRQDGNVSVKVPSQDAFAQAPPTGGTVGESFNPEMFGDTGDEFNNELELVLPPPNEAIDIDDEEL
jgi:hypothetical protein